MSNLVAVDAVAPVGHSVRCYSPQGAYWDFPFDAAEDGIGMLIFASFPHRRALIVAF